MIIDYDKIQRKIGYKFDNLALLQQAFITESYRVENGGSSNELLETIGKKAFELAVIRITLDKYQNKKDNNDARGIDFEHQKFLSITYEGNINNISTDIENKNLDVRAIELLGYHKCLLMSVNDLKAELNLKPEAKRNLFYAIIGAVSLDSSWEMDDITEVVATLINFDSYFGDETTIDDTVVNQLFKWCEKYLSYLPKYEYTDGENSFVCTLDIPNIGHFEGTGSCLIRARVSCAEEAYLHIQDYYVPNKYKEVLGFADMNNAVAQLEKLKEAGLIRSIKYEYQVLRDPNGEEIYSCSCIVPECTDTVSNYSKTKKDAQRLSAYQTLLSLMEELDEDEEDDEDFDDEDDDEDFDDEDEDDDEDFDDEDDEDEE